MAQEYTAYAHEAGAWWLRCQTPSAVRDGAVALWLKASARQTARTVRSFGAVGRDESGDRVRRLLHSHEIALHLWTDDRPTTWKQRIVARGQLRPDRCDREVTTPITSEAADLLADVPIGDALLIQDYGKDVCTGGLLSRLIHCALSESVPVLVDPARSRNWSNYVGVTLIKANWVEATE